MSTTSRPAVPTDWPTYWFQQLEQALADGEFDTAAEAATELKRLGVSVCYPRPILAAGKAVVCAR